MKGEFLSKQTIFEKIAKLLCPCCVAGEMLVSDTRYIRNHIGVCAAWARRIANAVQAHKPC